MFQNFNYNSRLTKRIPCQNDIHEIVFLFQLNQSNWNLDFIIHSKIESSTNNAEKNNWPIKRLIKYIMWLINFWNWQSIRSSTLNYFQIYRYFYNFVLYLVYFDIHFCHCWTKRDVINLKEFDHFKFYFLFFTDW